MSKHLSQPKRFSAVQDSLKQIKMITLSSWIEHFDFSIWIIKCKWINVLTILMNFILKSYAICKWLWKFDFYLLINHTLNYSATTCYIRSTNNNFLIVCLSQPSYRCNLPIANSSNKINHNAPWALFFLR